MSFAFRVVFFAAVGIAFLAAPPLTGAALLEWDRTEATVEMKPGENEAQASFTLTNNSPDAIRIEHVKTSCGCTGSVVRRKLIRSGESAEIVATFHKGKRKGGVNKNRLEVYLEGRPDPVATLRFVTIIPVLVKTQPQVIYWSAQSSRTPREVRVTLDRRYLESIESIKYDSDLFTVTEEARPGDSTERILKILPKDFSEAARGDIVITANGPDGMRETARIYAFVQP